MLDLKELIEKLWLVEGNANPDGNGVLDCNFVGQTLLILLKHIECQRDDLVQQSRVVSRQEYFHAELQVH